MTYGLLVILDIPLNPANLIILPLILGIGVDNGVHILHDFHSKPNEVYSTSPSTINAIMLTSTTTMVGFGSMMVSAHRGLYSLGAVLTIGVGACLFAHSVTLPALLTLFSRGRGLPLPLLQETKIGEVPRRRTSCAGRGPARHSENKTRPPRDPRTDSSRVVVR